MQRRILLIDDDADDRDLFREGLEAVAPAIEFSSALDCQEALSFLGSHTSDLPDVIFLDLNLPIISGWECFDRLKKDAKLKDIPVIFYSTSSHLKDKQHAREVGALAFYTKPHNFSDLKRMLRNVTHHMEQDAIEALAEA